MNRSLKVESDHKPTDGKLFNGCLSKDIHQYHFPFRCTGILANCPLMNKLSISKRVFRLITHSSQ